MKTPSQIAAEVATLLADNSKGAITASALRTVANDLADLGRFTQTGTGAVARTVDDKIREGISVKDFGAACDAAFDANGVLVSGTDDTAAIQAALNAAAAARVGKVFLPGVSRISGQISIPQGVSLVGLGAHWGGGTNGPDLTRATAVSGLAAWPAALPFSMVRFCLGPDDGVTARGRGGGLRDVMIDGQGVATRGVELVSWIQAKFYEVHVLDVTDVGWFLGTFSVGSNAINKSTAFTVMDHCSHAGTGKSLVLSGGGVDKWNSCYSTVNGFNAGSNIEIEDADSNKFFALTTAGTLTIHGAGSGSYHNNGAPNCARQNTIFGFEGAIVAKAATDASGRHSRGNVVYGLSLDTSLKPTIETGADLTVYMNGVDKLLGYGAATYGQAFTGTSCGLSGSAQTMTSGVTSVLSWANSDFPNTDFLDAWNSANPTRLTVPSGVKWVRLSSTVIWAVNGTGLRYADIIKNGSTATKYSADAMAGNATFGATNKLQTQWLSVTPGDYFEVRAQQTSGGNLDVVQGGSYFQAEFK